MRRRNILILIDKFDYHGSYINGPTRYFAWLCNNIEKEKFNVHLCALRSRGKSDEILKKEKIDVTYLNVGKFNPFTVNRLIKIIREWDIDVLHLTGYGSQTFGRIAGAICGKPTIIQEHWVDHNLGWVHSKVEQCLSHLTTRAIAISDYAKDYLIAKKGIGDEKIVVVPNGIPLDKFRYVDEGSGKEAKRGLCLEDDDKTIGIIGMLHINKGHRYFIEAASLLASRKPAVKFLIIGDGELREELKRQVNELGLDNTVLFLGHQENMPEIYSFLDIFVIASDSETFGLSLLEAMAAKKAIITTDCGGPSEIIQNGWNGIVIPVRDPKSMAEKIEYLLDNPTQSEFLSENAQRDIEKYDISIIVRKIQQIYEETAIQ